MNADRLQGTGYLRRGTRDLGAIAYKVECDAGGHASLVKFDRQPSAEDGDRLHLTLEDGRMIDCQVIDDSPYCSVVGEGPYYERRAAKR
jgi:hypothetical protein